MKLKIDKEFKWILVALTAFAAFMLIRWWWNNVSKEKDVKTSNEVIDKLNKEIDLNTLSISEEQARAIAQKIENAIYGFGTNFDAIKSAFGACKTRSDIMEVAAVYHKICKDYWTYSGSLWKDLADDLSNSEINELNQLLSYKNILFQI